MKWLLFIFLFFNMGYSCEAQLNPFTNKDTHWVYECLERHPEILWLADSDVRKTEEGISQAGESFSKQLFGQKFVEFDRTLLTLYALNLILDGSQSSYEKFTHAQPIEGKLSLASFQELSAKGQQLLHSNEGGMNETEMVKALEAALVLGDIGKSEKARAHFKPFGAQAVDHDDFYEEVICILSKYPELCPSYNRLTPPAKKLISSTANLIHYGHVTHLEGASCMFDKLKKASFTSQVPLLFDFFVHVCDVAGALGHLNQKSSLSYNEHCHQAMQAVTEACHLLLDPFKTCEDAYHYYLSKRAEWLGISLKDDLSAVIVRIGAMLRLFSQEEGLYLQNSFHQLSSSQQELIIEQFKPGKGLLKRTPTYMPAVLLNLANNEILGTSKEKRLLQAVTIGVPFIAAVLKQHQHALSNHQANPDAPLNFNLVAKVAKETPNKLKNGFKIDKEGHVWCTD